MHSGGTGERCGRNWSGGQRSQCLQWCPPPRRRSTRQPVPSTAAVKPDQIVDFSADTVAYDGDADVVTASGEVRMNREGNYLAADQVVWNRKSGEVPGHRQCRRSDPSRRQTCRRQCRAHRHAAGRHGREPARRARGWRPHRCAPRHPQGRDHDTRECNLFALPRNGRHRLPQATELGNHSGAGG